MYKRQNIAASIAIGLHFKVSIKNIKTAIESYVPKINRSELIETKNNRLILDAYNANPSSMRAALENFEKTSTNKTKIVVLGDMFELGKYSAKEHQNITDLIKESNSIKKAYLAGSHFSNTTTEHKMIQSFEDTESLLAVLKNETIKDAFILIKGSRGMALERVTQYL